MGGRNLILSGGADDAFEPTSARVRDIIGWEDISSDITDDVEGGLAVLEPEGYDILTVNTVSSALSERGRAAISAHLGRGGGILALQSALRCFGDWPRWPSVVGARWHQGRSRTSEPGPVRVSVRTGVHAITAGLGSFEVVDGICRFMDYEADLEPLASAAVDGSDHPVLWAREVSGGRVVHDGLGHEERSFSHPAHRILLCRSARWLLGLPAERDEREWLEEGEDREEDEEERSS